MNRRTLALAAISAIVGLGSYAPRGYDRDANAGRGRTLRRMARNARRAREAGTRLQAAEAKRKRKGQHRLATWTGVRA